MAVPDFQSCMLPILKLASDGQEHSFRSTIEALADHFKLGDNDRKELLPSGKIYRFYNNISWALTYMKKAGLFESTGRGKYRVTERGLKVLKESPPSINSRFLKRFSEFEEFQKSSIRVPEPQEPLTATYELPVPDDILEDTMELKSDLGSFPYTPEEMIEAYYQKLKKKIVQELLDQIKQCSPGFFEKLVVDLLVKMGYGGSRVDAGKAVGKSRDGGIDGIIKEDILGLDFVYIQAKKWDSSVGVGMVRDFSGALDSKKAKRGVFITTSQFSSEAEDYVKNIEKRIVLIDGIQLADFMITHGIGVTDVATYTLKRIDSDYFEEE